MKTKNETKHEKMKLLLMNELFDMVSALYKIVSFSENVVEIKNDDERFRQLSTAFCSAYYFAKTYFKETEIFENVERIFGFYMYDETIFKHMSADEDGVITAEVDCDVLHKIAILALFCIEQIKRY